jgi:hypothetical protein
MATLTVTPASSISAPNVLNASGIAAGVTVVRFRRAHGSKVEDIPGSFVVTGGTASYSDYLYPLDEPVTYMLYDNVWTEPPLATAAPTPAVSSQGKPWITDLVFPGLRYTDVIVAATGDRVRAGRISPYYVMAQPYAVTVGDVRSASTGTLQLFCRSHAERDRVLYAMSSGNPCALRVPVACRTVVDEMYFAPMDVTETPFGSRGACVLSVDYVEVDLADVTTYQPVTYGVQTSNAAAASLLYGSLLPSPTGLSRQFYGKTYADMYLSSTGIAP